MPKTEFLILGMPQQRAKLCDLLLEINGINIESTKEAKKPRYTLDENVSYQTHIACFS